MIYAPVIIPTLNRIDHLKELINSLQENNYAKYTELYVSLDYPPSEVYADGYKKVKEYLQNGITGFKNVNIYFQEQNLGPFANSFFLENEVGKKYDRYIFTEDDNIFSPNFLEYMDQCLEKYEDDDAVIAISGYVADGDWELPENILIKNSVLYCAWGLGRWIKKEKKYREEINFKYLADILLDFRRAVHLFKANDYFFRVCVDCVVKKEGAMIIKGGDMVPIDQVMTIYLLDSNKYIINPSVSKVKNCGDDGSGIHCGNSNRGRLQVIDESHTFSIANMHEIDDRRFLLKKYQSLYKNTWKRNIYTLLIWLRYYLIHHFLR